MTPAQKEWIDKATYQQLLEKQRFSCGDDPFFQDPEAWEHFSGTMVKLRNANPAAAVLASKNLGW